MIKDLCFEVIQKCTNNCKFCSSCSSMQATNIIEYELFQAVIEHLVKQGGIYEISISGGEPFLHKDLIRMVQLCKGYGIKVNVYTSGVVENRLKKLCVDYETLTPNEKYILEHMRTFDFSFIDKSVLFELKAAGLDKLIFDFQAVNIDVYNELMGTKGNLTNLLHSMLNAKSAGIYTEAHFIPMKPNVAEIEDVLELCEVGNIDRLSILKFVPQGRGRENAEDLALTQPELRQFCQRLQELKVKYKVNIRMGIPLTEKDSHLCTAGYDKLSIRYDGTVLPCVAFKELDSEKLEGVLKKNGLDFKVFSIRDNLDMLKPVEGSNRCALCKQVYANTKQAK